MEYILRCEIKPSTLNSTRNRHWSGRANETKAWREAGYFAAKDAKIPSMSAVCVTVQQIVASKGRGKLPDVAAIVEPVKAFCDGCLTDAGVIPDDNGKYLKSLCFLAPIRGDGNSVEFTITEWVEG